MVSENNKRKLKLLVIGGHHTPAFAMIKELQKQITTHNTELTTIWFGHRYSMVGDRSETLEYREVKNSGFKFYELKTPKFYRNRLSAFIFNFLGAQVGTFIQVFRVRPNLVVSFGGYLCVPVVFAARILRINCVTHEQTATAGLANRLIGRFCRKIFISFKSSEKFFPKNKTILTGNPLRREIFYDHGLFKFMNQKKTIYITGGKQGAHRINELIKQNLSELLGHYNLIHQCGSNTLTNDYEVLSGLRLSLPIEARDCYLLKTHFDFGEIGSVLARADYVISRSGANVVCELSALRKKSLLIPLPGSSHGEQEINAQLLSSVGLAVVLKESEMNCENLIDKLKKLEKLKADEEKIKSEFIFDGDKRMAEEVIKLIYSNAT